MRADEGSPVIPLALGAAGVLLFLWHVWYLDYTPDDAYITFRYAENWVRGRGIVFNPGEYVEGYTNFLWLCLSALALRAGLDPVVLGKSVGVASGVVGLYLTARLAGIVGAGARAAGVAVFVLAAHGSYAVWAVSALETGFFAMLSTMALCLTLLPVRRDLWASLVLGLLALTRPDGLYFLGASVAIRWRLDRKLPWRLLVLAVPMILVHEAWRWAYYGSLLPNTFSVRMGVGVSHLRVVVRGVEYLGRFVLRYETLTILLLLLAAVRRMPTREGRALLGVLAGWCGYVVLVGGDPHPFFRFWVPVTPLMCALAAAAPATVPPRTAGARLAYAALAGLWLLQPLGLSFVGAERQAPFSGLEIERALMTNRVALGRWMRANLPDDALVATAAAGAIPYFSGLRTVDVLGVNDRHIASRDVRGLLPTAHDKTDVEYVMGRRPSVLADATTWRVMELRLPAHWVPVEVPGVVGVQLIVDSRRIPLRGGRGPAREPAG